MLLSGRSDMAGRDLEHVLDIITREGADRLKELEPRELCLHYIVEGAKQLQAALPIAERLANHGNLYHELRDALEIATQAATRLLEGRPQYQFRPELEIDFPPA